MWRPAGLLVSLFATLPPAARGASPPARRAGARRRTRRSRCGDLRASWSRYSRPASASTSSLTSSPRHKEPAWRPASLSVDWRSASCCSSPASTTKTHRVR
ncbi:hypothetical protein AKJ09_00659 [Labilithrix luteola]|uniref:Uncharacterized protein n=1 Tax=Labilithrix luteola TaxID=1391654 RepID=A0A0K1PKE1_9BACT|nr:hypothetical protein AKJ09_00659 [Labilithrix luteola]